MQKRYLLIGILGIAALIVALPMIFSSEANRVSAQDQQTARIQRMTLSTTIETTGTIAPEDTILLAFGVAGTVREVLVELGDEVHAGDVLARLNTSELENQIARQEQAFIVQQANYDQLVEPPTAQEIAQARANLASAQAQLIQAEINLETSSNNQTINCASLTSAQRDLDRAQDAYDDYVRDGYELDATFIPDPDSEVGERLRNAQSAYDVAAAQCSETTPESQLAAAVTAAQASVDQAQAALDALMNGATATQIATAQAQLDQSRLQLEDARAALEDAVITAPFDGIVSNVNITAGQLVNTNTTAVTLVNHHQLHIDVSLDELDIAQVTEGQTAYILPEALNNVQIEGIVVRIAPTSTITDGVVTYAVRIDINNEDTLPIRIGMTTDVEILVGSLDEVLAVPTGAIQREGQTEFVEILNADNTTTRVDITTGATVEGFTVITGDITEGVTIVIPPQSAQAGSLPFGGN